MQPEPAAFASEAVLQPAARVRAAQLAWASTPLRTRLQFVRTLRHVLAEAAPQLIDAIPADLSRNRADTQAAEILPLLAAARFLETDAPRLLATRHLGRRGLPFWLAGVQSSVERVPLGTILVIAPANYPLLLPAVQTLQALTAGNAVTWKPGRNGEAIAQLFAELCARAGLPDKLLRITDDSIETAHREIATRPAKIVFTGSSKAGREVLALAAQHAIPVVAELSGCDAVFALPSANPRRLVAALTFGMRLNGSATCMAPRRLILIGAGHEALVSLLQQSFSTVDPIFLREPVRQHLATLLEDARTQGATIQGELGAVSMRPILITHGKPTLQLAQADLFAPVLTVFHVSDQAAALALDAECPFGLTAAVFGRESDALALGRDLPVGILLINDLIVPTADPRIPFGGRRASGFGSTRGAEGLLDLTAPRSVLVRRGKDTRHLEPTTATHEGLFGGVIALAHARDWRTRFSGLRQILSAARKL